MFDDIPKMDCYNYMTNPSHWLLTKKLAFKYVQPYEEWYTPLPRRPYHDRRRVWQQNTYSPTSLLSVAISIAVERMSEEEGVIYAFLKKTHMYASDFSNSSWGYRMSNKDYERIHKKTGIARHEINRRLNMINRSINRWLYLLQK